VTGIQRHCRRERSIAAPPKTLPSGEPNSTESKPDDEPSRNPCETAGTSLTPEIVLDAALPGRVAVAVQNVDLTESLVRVDADVVWCVRFHGLPGRWFSCNRHFITWRYRRGALSCLLTPRDETLSTLRGSPFRIT
jgi:hypothetical protein